MAVWDGRTEEQPNCMLTEPKKEPRPTERTASRGPPPRPVDLDQWPSLSFFSCNSPSAHTERLESLTRFHATADVSFSVYRWSTTSILRNDTRIEFWISLRPTLIKMGAVRRTKTKRRTRDYDQVRADVENPKHLSQYKATKDPEDLPGLGRHYCVECAKWFESDYNLVAHRKGKNHKRRLRLLKEEPHSQKLAEAAVGLGTDNGVRSQEADQMAMDN